MSADNVERQMAFILEQQAKFTVDLARLDARLENLTRVVETTAASVQELSRVSQTHDDKIHLLSDALLSLTNVVEEHEQRFKETDARLNILIDVVNKKFNKHQ